MLKYLILALLIIWLFKARPWRHTPTESPESQGKHVPDAPPGEPQTMVECAHCGLHLPKQDALRSGGTMTDSYYCCESHRRAGPRSSPSA